MQLNTVSGKWDRLWDLLHVGNRYSVSYSYLVSHQVVLIPLPILLPSFRHLIFAIV